MQYICARLRAREEGIRKAAARDGVQPVSISTASRGAGAETSLISRTHANHRARRARHMFAGYRAWLRQAIPGTIMALAPRFPGMLYGGAIAPGEFTRTSPS